MTNLKNKILIKINETVLKGKLPIAFYNSTIVKNNKKINTEINVNRKYMQLDIPEANLNLLISKIYNVF